MQEMDRAVRWVSGGLPNNDWMHSSDQGQACALVNRYVQAAPLSDTELQLRLQQVHAQAASLLNSMELPQHFFSLPAPQATQPHSKPTLPLAQLLRVAMGGAQCCSAALDDRQQHHLPILPQLLAAQLQLTPSGDQHPTELLSPGASKMEDAAEALICLQHAAAGESDAAAGSSLDAQHQSMLVDLDRSAISTPNNLNSHTPSGHLGQGSTGEPSALPRLSNQPGLSGKPGAFEMQQRHSSAAGGMRAQLSRQLGPIRQQKHRWARPVRGYTRKQEVKDLLNKVVEVPALVFGVDTPDLYYRARVVGPDKQHAKAVVVRTQDDKAMYYFPIGQVREWLQDTLTRRDSETPCISLNNSIHSDTHGIDVWPRKSTSQGASAICSDMHDDSSDGVLVDNWEGHNMHQCAGSEK